MEPRKTRDVLRYLKSIGWVRLRGGQGSHEISAGVLTQLKRAGVDVPAQWQ